MPVVVDGDARLCPFPRVTPRGSDPALGSYVDCLRIQDLMPGAQKGERRVGHRLAHTGFPCCLKGCYWSPGRTRLALLGSLQVDFLVEAGSLASLLTLGFKQW